MEKDDYFQTFFVAQITNKTLKMNMSQPERQWYWIHGFKRRYDRKGINQSNIRGVDQSTGINQSNIRGVDQSTGVNWLMMNRGFDKPNNRMLDQSGNKEVDQFSRGVDQNFLMGDESLQREGFDRFCRRGNGRFLVSMAEGFNNTEEDSGKYFPLFCRLLIFFQSQLFRKFFQLYHQSVKQFGSRSGLMEQSVSKLFARVISR